MSLIQNSNARSSFSTNPSDFPTVLSSLETSGGNSPLTPAQRADMLRLISNENNAAHPTGGQPQNNALIAPNAPQMPLNYSAQLANTRSELDNLVKMQAEQARSVQHLTNMLQPLSPTGSIPGIDNNQIPPPPLDLDNIFNSGDYFSDIPGVENNNSSKDTQNQADPNNAAATTTAGGKNDSSNNNITATADNNQTDDLFDFDTLAADPSQPTPNFFDTFDQFDGASSHGLSGLGDVGSTNMNMNNNDNNNLGSGVGQDLDRNRVTETFTSSEATSPANTLVDDNSQNHSQNHSRNQSQSQSQSQGGDGSTGHTHGSPQIMQRRSARNQR